MFSAGISTFFSVKYQIVNIIGFLGHTISVTNTKLCPCSTKASMINKRVWLCLNKTLFIKTDNELDLAKGLEFADSWSSKISGDIYIWNYFSLILLIRLFYISIQVKVNWQKINNNENKYHLRTMQMIFIHGKECNFFLVRCNWFIFFNFLSPHFGCLFVFVTMYQFDMLHFSISSAGQCHTLFLTN